MSSSDDERRADRLASQVIDGQFLPTDGSISTDTKDDIALTQEEKQRVADLLLLDALLASNQPSRQRAVERSFEQAMGRVRAEETPMAGAISEQTTTVSQPKRARRFGRRTLWLWSSSVAAVALLALVAWHYDPSRQAHAMVERIAGQVLTPTDRTYRVSIESNLPLAPAREARFYVRGGRCFVFDDPGPLGVRLLFGSDGSQRWQMTPAGPVSLKLSIPTPSGDAASAEENESTKLPQDAPYLQWETLLTRLRDRYELHVKRRELLPGGELRCDRLSAHRVDDFPASFVWPETVEVWANPATGVVQRMELRWRSGTIPAGPRTLIFELKSEQPLGESFFNAESHRDVR